MGLDIGERDRETGLFYDYRITDSIEFFGDIKVSRVLVIPDVHLKPWIFDMADRIDKNSYDTIVVLGDLVDDWGKGYVLDAYRQTLDRAVEFGRNITSLCDVMAIMMYRIYGMLRNRDIL